MPDIAIDGGLATRNRTGPDAGAGLIALRQKRVPRFRE